MTKTSLAKIAESLVTGESSLFLFFLSDPIPDLLSVANGSAPKRETLLLMCFASQGLTLPLIRDNG